MNNQKTLDNLKKLKGGKFEIEEIIESFGGKTVTVCGWARTVRDSKNIAFVEIKDCKAKNVSVYKDKTKEQILSTVQLFKELEIIGEQKVYGIISFPRRKKMFFNDFPYRDVYEATRWVKNYGIHLFASNEVDVVNATMLKPTEYK